MSGGVGKKSERAGVRVRSNQNGVSLAVLHEAFKLSQKPFV